MLCKVFARLEMAVLRVLLSVLLADLPLNGVTGPSTLPGTRSLRIAVFEMRFQH